MIRALLILLLVSPAWGATYYVATTGSDGADGSSGTPWATLQHAITNSTTGDTVNVGAGEFSQFLTNWTSGVTFNGTRGSGGEWQTVINPSTAFGSGWTAATEIGTGVYKQTGMAFTPRELTIGNKRVAFVYTTNTMADAINGAYNTNWATGIELLSMPAGVTVYSRWAKSTVNFWDGIEALWAANSGVCYLRLKDGSDPNGLAIRCAPNYDAAVSFGVFRPAIHLNGQSNVVWKNFLIRGAAGGFVVNGNANTIQSNSIANGYQAIVVTGTNNAILGNTISTDYYGYSDPGAWWADPSTEPSRAVVYSTAKYLMGGEESTSYDDRIYLNNGDSNVVAWNLVTNTMGVGVRISKTTHPPMQGLKVVSNTITHVSSVGILVTRRHSYTEIGNNQLRDNGDSNIRFHQLNYSAEETNLVVYVHRNQCWQPDGLGVQLLLSPSSSTAGRTVPMFRVYNNSFAGGFAGMTEDSDAVWTADLLTNSVFANNIFNGMKYYFSSDSQWNTSDWIGTYNYNLVTAPYPTYPNSTFPPWFGAQCLATDVVWANAEGMSFALTNGTPAIDAGLDVPATYPSWPWTGTKVGSQWDMGALEYGSGGGAGPGAAWTANIGTLILR